jgi:CIC family chloride channel protein
MSQSSREQSFLLFIAGALGVLSGLMAVFFEWLIRLSHHFFMVGPEFLYGESYVYHYLILPLTPALGGLIVGGLTWWFRLGAESAAAAEVMKWTAVDGGRVRKRVIGARLLTTAVFLGSGGSGGREGPIAQICGAMGSTLGQWLKVSTARLRLLVGCGAAAGIAAAFNAPIAGVIFAVELILADFNVVSFLPIVIASVMATTTKRLIQGDIPAFEAPPYVLVSPWEIFLYFILGIFCGVVAMVFFKAYFAADTFFKEKVRVHPIVKPAVGGLIVGIIGVFLPEVFGSGYETMDLMLNGQMIWTTAITLIVFKIIATSASLGSGGSGGIFAPSLFIGCMVGGAFGSLANMLFPGEVASSGGYAMVGVGAVMAAVVHAPLTNILMGYELTGNYQIILPIMTACIMSTYVMTRFSEESLYTEKLKRRGIRLWRGRDLTVMDRIKVGEVMRKQVTAIPEHTPFREVMSLMATSRDSYFPMVDAAGRLSGVISMQNVREILLDSEDLADLIVAKEIATPSVVTVDAADNLNEAMARFTEIDIEQLPVVSASNPRVVIGMISRMDVMATYKKEVLKRSTDDETP